MGWFFKDEKKEIELLKKKKNKEWYEKYSKEQKELALDDLENYYNKLSEAHKIEHKTLYEKYFDSIKNDKLTWQMTKSKVKVFKKEVDNHDLKEKIISFLKKEKTKLPASDLDFRLRIGDVDLVKELSEQMYRERKIGRTANYRYFTISSKTKSKVFTKKSSGNVDIESELKKLKSLLDEGLITKEQYEAKSNNLLGI